MIFDAPLDINGKFRQKDTTLKGKTLPDFIMSFLLLSKTDISLKLFFVHNVRYGSSVTFIIEVAYESFQYLDNHESQCFDFCIECK